MSFALQCQQNTLELTKGHHICVCSQESVHPSYPPNNSNVCFKKMNGTTQFSIVFCTKEIACMKNVDVNETINSGEAQSAKRKRRTFTLHQHCLKSGDCHYWLENERMGSLKQRPPHNSSILWWRVYEVREGSFNIFVTVLVWRKFKRQISQNLDKWNLNYLHGCIPLEISEKICLFFSQNLREPTL